MSFIRCPICAADWQPCARDTCKGCGARMLDSGEVKAPPRVASYRDSTEFEIVTCLAVGASAGWIVEYLGVTAREVERASSSFATRVEALLGGYAPKAARTAEWHADTLALLLASDLGVLG